jgi:hypothetical protein
MPEKPRRLCHGVTASGCRAVRGVGFENYWDKLRHGSFLSRICDVSNAAVSSRSVGIGRSVLVFENRLLEILIYLIVGLVFFVLGLMSADVNYQVLFFILTAFFIFAIFRPTSVS